jgi:type III secretory pathway lipoprotein EscJ
MEFMKRAQRIWDFRRTPLLLLAIGSAMLFANCSSRQLATVPNDSEANEILNVLRESGIDGVKEPVIEGTAKKYQISVHSDIFGDDNDYYGALQILQDNCLPLLDPPPVELGGYMSSVEVERAKIQRQLKININRQLRQLPGVTCVDVTFVAPQIEIILDPYPSTASVLIHYKTETPSFNDQEIRGLVAGSVAKLKPDAVNVKSIYQPVRPVQKSNRSNVGRFVVIGGAGLLIILGSVFLVYFLQRRRRASTEMIVRSEELEEIETVDS